MFENGGVGRAYEVVKQMVAEGGCAWHEQQTHESLIRYLIEETYEFAEAVETGASPDETAEELGDVLYQVLFHAAIAELSGEGYTLQTVGDNLAEKLVARHPHVFGNRGYMSVEELEDEWEHLKEAAAGEKRGTRHALEGIPSGMPPIARATKIVDRLRRAGISELPEISGSAAADDTAVTEHSVGEQILDLIKLAHTNGVDADRALRLATERMVDATNRTTESNRE